jgi:uncharacterized protein
MDLSGARQYIVDRLQKELKPILFYHSPEHTLDVYDAASRLARLENIDPETIKLIETAAIYHDCGMLVTYHKHEEASCEIARNILPGFGFQEGQIDHICELILVTKLPQVTNSVAEQILCDADLDPLGREDFFINSFKLKLEWEANGILKCSLKEWLEKQITFLEMHNYYTPSQIMLRQEQKMLNLLALKELFR